jgi:putative addiction module component (TIGR02574 family)
VLPAIQGLDEERPEIFPLFASRRAEGFRRTRRIATNVWADVAPCHRIGSVPLPDLEAEALKLPLADRAHLAEKLLQSLDTLPDEENRRLWNEEAVRRDAELDTDPSRGRPAEDVFREARARLR